jgi:hypothetical protein
MNHVCESLQPFQEYIHQVNSLPYEIPELMAKVNLIFFNF